MVGVKTMIIDTHSYPTLASIREICVEHQVAILVVADHLHVPSELHYQNKHRRVRVLTWWTKSDPQLSGERSSQFRRAEQFGDKARAAPCSVANLDFSTTYGSLF